ncbi:MAG TPA: A/G-specific adenine glycosylase [Phycisphaerales bacterium]|nr:A/G-specific adenine glycosylase [Phycisphaerales bacterium]
MAIPAAGADDSALDRALVAWFRANARELPWRAVDPATGRRDAYRSLVSEVMLQQTQVARVIEKFDAFMRRFPTVQALAAAPLDAVLAEWSGLGYYRRARHLHACAQGVVERHAGVIPADVPALLKLPGIGRYTAGAIASMVYHRPEPIVDGNVARVLLRIRGQQMDQKSGMAWTWKETERLAPQSRDIASFNEGLMELGATVCTPANPRCDQCPVASQCAARARGLQGQIPAPKVLAQRSALHMACVVVRDHRGRVLLEKRPDTGLWAGMWQPPTLESPGKLPTRKAVAAALGAEGLTRIESFVHTTTHRDVQFTVYEAASVPAAARRWFTPVDAAKLAMGNPQRRIITRRSRD